MILICSEASLTSPWVDKEVEKALQKEERLWKERKKKTLAIIPLDLDGYVFDGWECGKASEVTSRLVADFKTADEKPEELEKLIRQLRL